MPDIEYLIYPDIGQNISQFNINDPALIEIYLAWHVTIPVGSQILVPDPLITQTLVVKIHIAHPCCKGSSMSEKGMITM